VERRPAIRDAVGVDVTRRRARAARWATAGVLPLAVLALLLAEPRLDLRWEDDAVHFWIVLAAGLVSVAVGYAVRESGMRRRTRASS
jgi:hypothetical protein